MPKEKICLGSFGRVFGVKGEIYFNLYGSPDILQTADSLFLDDGTALVIQHVTLGPDGRYLIKFRGVNSAEQAETLVNKKAYVKGRTGSGDFYTTSELIEMDVVLNGSIVGKVLDLQGTEDAPYLVLDINGKEMRTPFIKEALRIDREAKKVEIISEGYLV